MFDKNNYINSIQEETYNIFKNQFINYDIKYKPLNDMTIIKPTILLLHPRISQFDYEKVYNGQNKYTFYINVFCLSDNELSPSEIAGEITIFVNKNQDKFSIQGLNNVKIISAEKANNSNSTGSQSIYGYMCILKGYVIF